MKVEDLGVGYANQNANNENNLSPLNKKTRFFYFLSIYQFCSYKTSILSFLATIYSLFQNGFISFWPHLDLIKKPIVDKYDFIRTPLVFEENLTNAFFLYSTDKEPENLYLFSFLIFLPSIFFFALSLSCIFLYHFKKIINHQLLLCFIIFVHIICPIITVPLGFQIGWLISRVTNMKEMEILGKSIDGLGSIPVFTALIVLDFFLFFFDIILTILMNVVNSNSVVHISSFLSSSNFIFQSFVQLFPSVILFFSNILPLFYSKIRHFIVFLHIIYCICTTIGCFWIPFNHVRVNSFFAAFSTTMMISDFICFTKLNLEWYRYLIFICSLIVLYIIFSFFIKLRIKFIFKKYIKKEEENEDNSPNKNKKLATKKSANVNPAVFNSYNDFILAPTGFEDQTITQNLSVLRIALISQNRVFLDGRLIDLIATKAEKDQDKIELASLICYFPEFQTIFFAILTGLRRSRFLPILKEFQLFQLRCYDTSCHTEAKIDQIDEVLRESSAISINLRSFWQLIDSECDSFTETNLSKHKLKTNFFSLFDRLSRSIENCENKWRSILTIYPNNSIISDEYPKFLIEFCGNFINASELKSTSSQMREGKLYEYNPFAISFLHSYPFYYRQILGKQTLIKSIDDIDIYKKIESVSDLIEMPEARFEFQRACRSSYPVSIIFFLILSVIPLMFIIVFWVYGFYSFGHFQHVTEGMYFVINTGFLGQQISKNLISAILDYGQLPNVGVAPTPDEIFSTLYANNVSDRFDSKKTGSLIPLTGEYKSSLSAVSERGMGLIDYLHNTTLEQIEKGNGFQGVLDTFYSNTLESTYYLSKSEPLKSTSNLQSLLISFYTYYFTMSFDYNYSYINDTEFYHATMAGAQVLDRLDQISEETIENSIKIFDKEKGFYSTGLYVISGVYLAVSSILSWIDFFFILLSFKKICNSLCYFPKTVKQNATNLFVKNKANENANPNNSSENDEELKDINSRIKNQVIFCLIVTTIINIGLSATILIFHFHYNKYRDNLTSISKLTHYYSVETAQTIEVLYSVMAAPTFGQVIPEVDEKYKKKLTATINKFINTHQNTGTLSFEDFCGLKGVYIELLNDLKTKQKCDDYPDKTQHETLSCLNEESMIYAYIDLAQKLESHADDTLLLKTDTFKQFIHFSLSHVYYNVRNFGNYLMLVALDKVIIFDHSITIFGSVSIVIACLLFFMNIYIYFRIRRVFRILFVFISRVLPSDIIENSELMYSLFGIKNSNKAKIDNSETFFLVQESSSPLVFVDRSALIEFVNTAFTDTFGIEPNYIVGQPISRIISDDDVLYLIDTLKFFGARKLPVKTIKCTKRNGNQATFDITLIPIAEVSKEKQKQKESNRNEIANNDPNNKKDSNSDDETRDVFVYRLAIVFVDKTTKKTMKKKCRALQKTNEMLINSIFPSSINLFGEGYLQMCAICLIKLPNNIETRKKSSTLLTQRQNIYQLLYDKLSIYPLLSPIDAKNGLFAVAACRKNDPTELAIECLNFAFNAIDEFSGIMTRQASSLELGISINNPLYAVVETGGELKIGWSGDKIMKTFVTGELMERALKVLDFAAGVGNVCVSNTTYEYVMQHDYYFSKKVIPDTICGENSIYVVSGGSNFDDVRFESKTNVYTSESESNVGQSESLGFIEKLKEDETIQVPSDEDE